MIDPWQVSLSFLLAGVGSLACVGVFWLVVSYGQVRDVRAGRLNRADPTVTGLARWWLREV